MLRLDIHVSLGARQAVRGVGAALGPGAILGSTRAELLHPIVWTATVSSPYSLAGLNCFRHSLRHGFSISILRATPRNLRTSAATNIETKSSLRDSKTSYGVGSTKSTPARLRPGFQKFVVLCGW